MSSQHEARRLAQPARQLELLDGYAGCDGAAAAMADGLARAPRAPRAALDAARSQARRRGAAAGSSWRTWWRGSTPLAVEPGEPEALRAESVSGCGTWTS